MAATSTRKVVLLELNEITWNLIDPLIEKGVLPTFARLKREGAVGSPLSVDLGKHLDPWITWTTVNSGVPQAEHGVEFLQQPPESIKAKRIWDYLDEAGVPVGIYGDMCSWPAKAVKGFFVPDTFAQDTGTYPAELEPIQKLNLTYTRSTRLPTDDDTLLFKAKLGASLFGLGLRPATALKIAGQLAAERLNDVRWKRVALQPMVNFDFFTHQYRKHQPRYASFFSNHVAHYQHTYWKAMQPDEFAPVETTQKEIDTYGGAIEYGYRTADALIERFLGFLDKDTTLVIASSMGQKPFKTALKTGKRVQQLRSLEKLIDILGMTGRAKAISMMSDQFNIYCEEKGGLDHIYQMVAAVYVDTPEQPMFTPDVVDGAVTLTIRPYDNTGPDSKIHFPLCPGGPEHRYDDLVYISTQTKSGCHDPKGMLVFWGAGVKAGAAIEDCTNLDMAPTLLALLGQPIPDVMKGRLLSEAFAGGLSAERRPVPGLAAV